MHRVYAAGASLSAVGRLYGRPGSWVKQHFLRAGLPVRTEEEALRVETERVEAEAIRQWEHEMEVALLGEEAADPCDREDDQLEEQDVSEEDWQELDDRIVALHVLRWPPGTIAQALNLSRQRVKLALRRNGHDV